MRFDTVIDSTCSKLHRIHITLVYIYIAVHTLKWTWTCCMWMCVSMSLVYFGVVRENWPEFMLFGGAVDQIDLCTFFSLCLFHFTFCFVPISMWPIALKIPIIESKEHSNSHEYTYMRRMQMVKICSTICDRNIWSMRLTAKSSIALKWKGKIRLSPEIKNRVRILVIFLYLFLFDIFHFDVYVRVMIWYYFRNSTLVSNG